MIVQLEISEEQLAKIADLVAMKIRDRKADTYSKYQAATILGVHHRTIDRRIEAGLIPRVPNLKSVRIPAAFIDKLVNPNPDA